MSEKKPTPEELWERVGYTQTAADADAFLSGRPVSDAARNDAEDAIRAALGVRDAHDLVLPGIYVDAYLRGRERWFREHLEVRA
jgi:hypothetical protein